MHFYSPKSWFKVEHALKTLSSFFVVNPWRIYARITSSAEISLTNNLMGYLYAAAEILPSTSTVISNIGVRIGQYYKDLSHV